MRIAVWTICLCVFASTAIAQKEPSATRVPTDLKITIDDTGTQQYATYVQSTIHADGLATFQYTRRGLPSKPSGPYFAIIDGKEVQILPEPRKPLRKNDRLSNQQLIELVGSIESSGFYLMEDRYYGNPALKNGTCTNHSSAKAISVYANGKAKSVYFFLGCTYEKFEPLEKFMELYKRIEEMLSTVNLKEIEDDTAPNKVQKQL